MKKRIEHKKFPLIFAKGVVLGLLVSHQIAEAELEKPLDEETDSTDDGSSLENMMGVPEGFMIK